MCLRRAICSPSSSDDVLCYAQLLAAEDLSPPSLGQGADTLTLPLNQLAAEPKGSDMADTPRVCADSTSGDREPERKSLKGAVVANGRMSSSSHCLQQPTAAEPAGRPAMDGCGAGPAAAPGDPQVGTAGKGGVPGAGSLPGAAAAGWEGWDWASCELSAGFHGAPRASGAPRGPGTPPWLALNPRPSSPSPSPAAAAGAPAQRCAAAPSRLRWPAGQAGPQLAVAPAGASPNGEAAQGGPAPGDPVLACVRMWLPHDLAASKAYLRGSMVTQARISRMVLSPAFDEDLLGRLSLLMS